MPASLLFVRTLSNIEADFPKEREHWEHGEELAVDENEDGSVPEITLAHLEETARFVRRSSQGSDIRRYEMFAQSLQDSRGFSNSSSLWKAWVDRSHLLPRQRPTLHSGGTVLREVLAVASDAFVLVPFSFW